MATTKTDQLSEEIYAERMAHMYRTRPADRPLAEALVRELLGDDCGEITWTDSLPTTAPTYWLSTEVSQGWVAYYAAARRAGIDDEPELCDRAELLQRVLDEVWHVCVSPSGTVLCDFPSIYAVDADGALHSESGPAIMLRSGEYLLCWHGIRLPAAIAVKDARGVPRIDPARVTTALIDAEPNQEVRRALIALYRGGEAGWLRDTGATPIDRDESVCAELYRLPDDELVAVVWDGVPQGPSGAAPRYALRVNRECRPMHLGPDGRIVYGQPQQATARNAVASTYGLTGEEYQHVSRT